MLTASENVAITLELYDTLMENNNTLDEFIAAIMNNFRLSWDKETLVLDIDGSEDLITLFKIKYPTTYNKRLERLRKEREESESREADMEAPTYAGD